LKSGRTSAPRSPQAADKARLDVGQPQGPAVCIHRYAVAATVVGAIDQDATHAPLVAHFTERDFLGSRCEHYFDSALSFSG
jgi:hypothetical protein